MSFVARNHPQQVDARGARDDVDDRGTLPEIFDPLMAQYKFTIDVAAAAHNAKVERYYDIDDDGLSQSWAEERVWCNPPFSRIRPWVEKAWSDTAEVVVMLLPANRCEQKWWQLLVEPYRDQPGSPLTLRFLPGRPRFIMHGRGEHDVPPNSRPPFGCCLLIWDRRTPDWLREAVQLELGT